jgi:hypothetical protein
LNETMRNLAKEREREHVDLSASWSALHRDEEELQKRSKRFTRTCREIEQLHDTKTKEFECAKMRWNTEREERERETREKNDIETDERKRKDREALDALALARERWFRERALKEEESEVAARKRADLEEEDRRNREREASEKGHRERDQWFLDREIEKQHLHEKEREFEKAKDQFQRSQKIASEEMDQLRTATRIECETMRKEAATHLKKCTEFERRMRAGLEEMRKSFESTIDAKLTAAREYEEGVTRREMAARQELQDREDSFRRVMTERISMQDDLDNRARDRLEVTLRDKEDEWKRERDELMGNHQDELQRKDEWHQAKMQEQEGCEEERANKRNEKIDALERELGSIRDAHEKEKRAKETEWGDLFRGREASFKAEFVRQIEANERAMASERKHWSDSAKEMETEHGKKMEYKIVEEEKEREKLNMEIQQAKQIAEQEMLHAKERHAKEILVWKGKVQKKDEEQARARAEIERVKNLLSQKNTISQNDPLWDSLNADIFYSARNIPDCKKINL